MMLIEYIGPDGVVRYNTKPIGNGEILGVPDYDGEALLTRPDFIDSEPPGKPELEIDTEE